MKTHVKNPSLLLGLIASLGLMLAIPPAHAAAHFQQLKSFGFADQMGQNPYAPLMHGSNGVLYGTTYSGGSKNAGTVFRANKDGSGYQVLHHFDGAGEEFPTYGLVEGSDGALYGTAGNNFVNSTNRGTVFKLNQDGSGYAVLRRFASPGGDGQLPGSVLEGSDGSLYGTASSGGSTNGGLVFKLNKDGSGYVVVRNFGLFPGDGRNPQAGLLQGSDGALYGVTSSGGHTNAGTVFKLNKDGSGYALLRSFDGSAAGDGQRPHGTLAQGNDGMLYGVTDRGGASDAGTVFRLNKDGSGYQVVHDFNGSDGHSPVGLTEGQDGALFGATSSGGPPGFYNGTAFKLNKDGTGFYLLHSFGSNGGDGLTPRAGMVQGSDGALYGTTTGGGIQGQGGSLGTLFTVNTNGSGYQTLRAFNNSGGDGYDPVAGLVEATNGMLYGTTVYGGSSSLGTIYQLNKNGSGYAILHSFSTNGGDGYHPVAELLPASDGALYGTAADGGGTNWGAVFKLNLDGSGYGVLRSFSAASGAASGPAAALVEGSDGVLYGTSYYANGWWSGDGTVFKLNKDGTG